MTTGDTILDVGGPPPDGATAIWLRIPGLPQLLASAVLEDGGPGRDPDYTRRNRYLLIAVGAAAAAGIPVGFRFDPKEPDWPVVYFELPGVGQVSWHLPQHEQEYDGHSTPTKNQRIDTWLAQIEGRLESSTPPESEEPSWSGLAALECSSADCICHHTTESGNGVTHCPAHNDLIPSFIIGAAHGYQTWHCSAGCNPNKVLSTPWGRQHLAV
jgi:hypothetical protein